MALNKIHKEKRDKQMAHMREKMAERKKKKLRKLQNQHDAEISEVRIKSVMIGFIFFTIQLSCMGVNLASLCLSVCRQSLVHVIVSMYSKFMHGFLLNF